MADSVAENRRARRRTVRARVSCSGDTQSFAGITRNMTADGLYMETDRAVESGTEIELEISLPGDTGPVKAVGRVVRGAMNEAEWPGIGIEFTHVDEADRDRLEAFLAANGGADHRDDAA